MIAIAICVPVAGILTIAKGTLPLASFGPHAYGARQGLLMVPARIAQALAPFLFGLFVDWWSLGALWVSSLMGLAAFGALVWLARLGWSRQPCTAS